MIIEFTNCKQKYTKHHFISYFS